MDRKILLWSIALFFGSAILFRAIDSAVASTTVSLAIQAGALAAIIVAIVLIAKRRS